MLSDFLLHISRVLARCNVRSLLLAINCHSYAVLGSELVHSFIYSWKPCSRLINLLLLKRFNLSYLCSKYLSLQFLLCWLASQNLMHFPVLELPLQACQVNSVVVIMHANKKAKFISLEAMRIYLSTRFHSFHQRTLTFFSPPQLIEKVTRI